MSFSFPGFLSAKIEFLNTIKLGAIKLLVSEQICFREEAVVAAVFHLVVAAEDLEEVGSGEAIRFHWAM